MSGARVALPVLVVLALASCASGQKKPKQGDEGDYTKAFAELEKNDKDDTSAKMPAGDGDDRPKGPVYPAPFTAEQIRSATKNGRTYRYKIEAPNEQAHEHVITFRNVDDGGAEVHTGGDRSKRMSWLTLQKHSEFPKDKVTTRTEKLKTPAGKFECIVYTVAADEGEVWTYYFAKKLPGAPVYYFVERNGHRLRTTTLVEHIAGQ